MVDIAPDKSLSQTQNHGQRLTLTPIKGRERAEAPIVATTTLTPSSNLRVTKWPGACSVWHHVLAALRRGTALGWDATHFAGAILLAML